MWHGAGSRCMRGEIIYINKRSVPINPVELLNWGGGGIKEKENYLALRALAHIEGMHRAYSLFRRAYGFWFSINTYAKVPHLNRVMQLCRIKNSLQIEEQLRREKQLEIYLHKL